MSLEFELGPVDFYPGAMEHLRQDKDGEVGRDLYKRGQKLLALSKQSAPKETGALAASLYLRYERGAVNPSIIVGSKLNYAYYVHEGTRPHEITPDLPGRVLRFVVNGRVVYATKVHNPGQRPNPFMSRHLRSIVR